MRSFYRAQGILLSAEKLEFQSDPKRWPRWRADFPFEGKQTHLAGSYYSIDVSMINPFIEICTYLAIDRSKRSWRPGYVFRRLIKSHHRNELISLLETNKAIVLKEEAMKSLDFEAAAFIKLGISKSRIPKILFSQLFMPAPWRVNETSNIPPLWSFVPSPFLVSFFILIRVAIRK